MYYNNVNGYQCKKHSLDRIISGVNPDLVALCETKRPAKTSNTSDVLERYEVIERNLKQGQEGMMICAKKGTFNGVKEVTETEMRCFLTVRITYTNLTLRIILLHAPQETDSSESREDFFNELSTQVERGLDSEDVIVVVGDFNSRVEEKQGEVQGTSSNGKLMVELLKEYELVVCNFDSRTEGVWTRIQANKDGSVDKSVIDYILLRPDVIPAMSHLLTDENKIYCPYSEKVRKGEKQAVFSDHCAMVMNLKLDCGTPKDSTNHRKTWNFNEDGYLLYDEESKQGFNSDYEMSTATEAYSEIQNGLIIFKNYFASVSRRRRLGEQ